MAKTKNKRNSGMADKVQSKKKGEIHKKRLNPFEVHINREKLKVLGKKSKHDRGLPGVSRAKAVQKRKETLGTEMRLMHKTNTFIDKRIGEKNNQLSAEDRMIARFAAERARQHSKRNIYNLADDEVLTHRGQTLEQIEKFDDPRSDEEGDDEKAFGGLDTDFVSDAHFGGGVLSKAGADGAKSHKDLIEQLIAESKKRKAEKQKEKEQTLDLTEKLDSEWKDLQPVVFKKMRVEDPPPKSSPQQEQSSESKSNAQQEPGSESVIDRLLSQQQRRSDDYDKMMRELKFEKRGTPSDGLKNDEKQAKEDRARLEQWERERELRMMGEIETVAAVPTANKHRSADDLEDNFELEDEHQFMLAYDKDGKPLVPERVLRDYSVPNAKPKFQDGVSDTSSDENENDDDDDDEDDSQEDDVDQSGHGNELSESKVKQSKGKQDDSENDTSADEGSSDDNNDEGEMKRDLVKDHDHDEKEEESSSSDEQNHIKHAKESSGKSNKSSKNETDKTNKNKEKEDLNKQSQGKIKENKNTNSKRSVKYNSESILFQNDNKHDKSESQSDDDDDNNDEDASEDDIDESDDENNENEGDKDDLADLRMSDGESDDDQIGEGDAVKIGSFFDLKKAEGDNLKELLANKTPSQQSVALEKLIKSYDPSLGESNKESLSRLYAHMLQYVHDIFTGLTTEGDVIKAFLIFDKIAPYFYDLARTNKVSAKKYMVELLKEKHDLYLKKPKIIPDLNTLVFFKLISLIYPTSDYKHPVCSPALLFMSEILTTAKFNDARSISRGFFVLSLILEYTVLSKRLVPSAINYLRGILYLASNTTIVNPIQVVPPFRLRRDAKLLNLERDCSKTKMAVSKMSAKDLVAQEVDDDFKIRTLLTTTVMLKEFFDNHNDLQAQECIFAPHLQLYGRIDTDLYPKKVASTVTQVIKYMKSSLEVKTYAPLSKEKKKPKVLRLYEPDIQEVFTGNKNAKLPRDQAERKRLEGKIKKEMKGALREIRRDRAYISNVKIRQKIQSDNVRKDKVKQIYKEASIQQGEINKLKRMK